ncbi:hexokinase family protein [Dehalobacterium formicoaceticum]|uniref:Hexokinase n=1 Tax=Dehalobacterium formicoaceticum TaxID=51515 RepID=A0ABT1Y076_9FIRM|nr:hexokinase [Dehalobacterium formicoaceticum]MCR6544274.1 hypothetical protein [Dehalobacterium formicoaceticum]
MKERDQVQAFLHKYHMDGSETPFQEQCALFRREMKQGLAGKESSLSMLPAYIQPKDQIPADERVIALDAGGTNLRIASLYFTPTGRPVIENFQIHPMPGSKGEISKDEFFRTLASFVKPLLNYSQRIGFCFSYPMEMRSDGDGRLIRFTKEILAPEVEGAAIGKNLMEAIREQGTGDEKKIVLLNDTVATLLAGQGATDGRSYDGFIGFILGTGTNAAYLEQNKNIQKVSDLDPEKSMIINMEWGNYSKAPQGLIDQSLDQTFSDPGAYLFEKMVAGAYLGKLTLAVLKKAGADGLFSPDFTESLTKVSDLETKDLDDFLAFPPGEKNPLTSCIQAGREKDRILVYWLIDGLLERVALFTAVNLTGLICHLGKGKNPCAPIGIMTEGTTFFALKGLRGKIEYYLKKCLADYSGVSYEFLSLEHASLIGAAIAGLN